VRKGYVSFGSKCETVKKFRLSVWEISATAITDVNYANEA